MMSQLSVHCTMNLVMEQLEGPFLNIMGDLHSNGTIKMLVRLDNKLLLSNVTFTENGNTKSLFFQLTRNSAAVGYSSIVWSTWPTDMRTKHPTFGTFGTLHQKAILQWPVPASIVNLNALDLL
jgi:hypothetical protein